MTGQTVALLPQPALLPQFNPIPGRIAEEGLNGPVQPLPAVWAALASDGLFARLVLGIAGYAFQQTTRDSG
jgi:hypothetical protein